MRYEIRDKIRNEELGIRSEEVFFGNVVAFDDEQIPDSSNWGRTGVSGPSFIPIPRFLVGAGSKPARNPAGTMPFPARRGGRLYGIPARLYKANETESLFKKPIPNS